MHPPPQHRRPQVIAHHLIWTLYGHWLPNDPRGSGSVEVLQEKLCVLGPLHHGRKPEREQPSRGELRGFYEKAEPLLAHDTVWLHEAARAALAASLQEIAEQHNYTVWAAAVLSNHVHLVVRKHRDEALTMWRTVASDTRLPVRRAMGLAEAHPVWADRPYKVFLTTPERVRDCVRYVERNPVKEGLGPQSFGWVTPYDGWPFHKRCVTVVRRALASVTCARDRLRRSHVGRIACVFAAGRLNPSAPRGSRCPSRAPKLACAAANQFTL